MTSWRFNILPLSGGKENRKRFDAYSQHFIKKQSGSDKLLNYDIQQNFSHSFLAFIEKWSHKSLHPTVRQSCSIIVARKQHVKVNGCFTLELKCAEPVCSETSRGCWMAVKWDYEHHCCAASFTCLNDERNGRCKCRAGRFKGEHTT